MSERYGMDEGVCGVCHEATSHYQSPYGYWFCADHRHDRRGRLVDDLRQLGVRGGGRGYTGMVVHKDAIRLLLAYIDDPDVSAAYNALKEWYG